jgi:hypothetical protein
MGVLEDHQHRALTGQGPDLKRERLKRFLPALRRGQIERAIAVVALRDRRRGPYSGARTVELVSREVRRRVEARSQTQWLFHHTPRDATGPIAYEAQPNRPVK